MPKLKTVSKWTLALLFTAAGINHFANEPFYTRIMPPYLPQPKLLVYLSGIFEAGLGAGLLVPQLSRLSAWGLIALLFAVFPANWHMAKHPEQFPEYPAAALRWRAPLQILFVAWVSWHTRRGESKPR